VIEASTLRLEIAIGGWHWSLERQPGTG